MILKCKICGKMEDTSHWSEDCSKVMEKEHLCYDCWFWHTQHQCDLNDRGQYKYAIVNGNHYVLEDPTDGYFKGFGGALFIFLFNDGHLKKCTNTWYQGDMKTYNPYWRTVMPDNARILHLSKDAAEIAEMYALCVIGLDQAKELMTEAGYKIDKDWEDYVEAYIAEYNKFCESFYQP